MKNCFLARKIYSAKEPLDITIEELALIKDKVGKYSSTLVVGLVYDALESSHEPAKKKK